MSKEKLLNLKDRVEQINRELRDTYKEGLQEFARDVFEANPKLESFSWTQYTPYFNDGEPCEFGINGDYPRVKIVGMEDSLELDYEIIRNNGTWQAPKYAVSDEAKEYITVGEAQAIKESISSFMENAIYPFESQVQSILGEGEVIVDRDGIDVEDYDHD